MIFDLFGGFGNQSGAVTCRSIEFTAVRSIVDYTRGQVEGHYRGLDLNVVSRNDEDNLEPLRNVGVDAVAKQDG